MPEIAITALENNIHCADFDSARVLQVQAIADSSTGLAARKAQGLLNFYYGYSYETVQSGTGGAQQLIAHPSNNFAPAEVLYQPLVAMPNPAKGDVTFKYRLKSDAPALLAVFDVNGRLVHSFELENQNGSIGWQMKGQSHGVYYCRVSQPGNIYPSLKLVLVR